MVYEKKIELGGNTDWDTHYSGSVKVLDADGNFQEGAFAFTLDMTPPEGAIQVDSFRWNQLVYYPAEQNTLFLNREATVSYRAEDSCSGVRRVSYLSVSYTHLPAGILIESKRCCRADQRNLVFLRQQFPPEADGIGYNQIWLILSYVLRKPVVHTNCCLDGI